jgi:hypothetical protein
MIRDLGHFGLGLQHNEDRIKELSPKNIPELLREVATIAN